MNVPARMKINSHVRGVTDRGRGKKCLYFPLLCGNALSFLFMKINKMSWEKS
jgi:hypothetical protein